MVAETVSVQFVFNFNLYNTSRSVRLWFLTQMPNKIKFMPQRKSYFGTADEMMM